MKEERCLMPGGEEGFLEVGFVIGVGGVSVNG